MYTVKKLNKLQKQEKYKRRPGITQSNFFFGVCKLGLDNLKNNK